MTLQCADVAPGRRITPAIRVLDADGAPVTTASAWPASIYGPGGPATPLLGPANLVHQGEGWWGLPFSAPATEGLYRLVVPSISFAGEVWTNQEVPFTVGPVPPECRTLREILVAVCQQLGCGLLGGVTGAVTTTPATFIDGQWVDPGLAVGEFVGDEVLWFTPPVGALIVNPSRVTGLDPALGKVTYTPGLASVAAGQRYLLIRAGRGGYRYQRIREAVDATIADLARRVDVSDTATLTTAMARHHYTLPGSWLGVDRVQIRPPNYAEDRWEDVAAHYWEYLPDTRQLYLRLAPGEGFPLKVWGTVAPQPPYRLGGLVRLPYTAVRDAAVGFLALPEAQRAGYLLQRARAGQLRAGEP